MVGLRDSRNRLRRPCLTETGWADVPMMCHTRRNRPFDDSTARNLGNLHKTPSLSASDPGRIFWSGVALLRTAGVRSANAAEHCARRRRRACASAGRTVGISGLGFSGVTNGGARGRHRQSARGTGSRLDGGAAVSLAWTDGSGRWAIATAERWRCVAHRFFAIREDREGSRGAGPLRGLDVEPTPTLRFAYPGSFSVRDVFAKECGRLVPQGSGRAVARQAS